MHRRVASSLGDWQTPLMNASPSSGSSQPAQMRITVVLPAPFGPRSPTTRREYRATHRAAPRGAPRFARAAEGKRARNACCPHRLRHGGNPFFHTRSAIARYAATPSHAVEQQRHHQCVGCALPAATASRSHSGWSIIGQGVSRFSVSGAHARIALKNGDSRISTTADVVSRERVERAWLGAAPHR